MQIWSVYNLKGGVGKTATAVNLAYLASRAGQQVLLWDLDPQGGASWLCGVKPKLSVKAEKLIREKVPIGKVIRASSYEGLDVIPADFAHRNLDVMLRKNDSDSGLFRRLLQPCSEQYGLVIVDCPPSLSRLAEIIFAMTDTLVMPLLPSHLSQRASEQVQERLDKLKRRPERVLPFLSMVDMRRSLHQQWVKNAPDLPGKCLRTRIPYSAVVEKMGEHRAPVEVFAPRSPAAEAYRQLWKEIRKREGELV